MLLKSLWKQPSYCEGLFPGPWFVMRRVSLGYMVNTHQHGCHCGIITKYCDHSQSLKTGGIYVKAPLVFVWVFVCVCGAFFLINAYFDALETEVFPCHFY